MSLAFWLRYSTRALRRSGRRSLFALICIAVGVAGVVALQTATLTVQSALTSNIRAANGGDVSLVTQDAPLGQADLRVFRRLQNQGRITAWTAVSTLHATAVGPAHALIPFEVHIVSPPYPLGGEPTFVSPGNGTVNGLLRNHGDVLITSVLGDELGAHVGDRLVVNSIGGRGLTVTVQGILAETSFQHAAVMTVEARDRAILASGPPRYVEIYADTTGNSTALASNLRQRFPLATIQTVQEALQSANAQVHDFRQFMLLVGLLALLIAGIGILNAMQSLLAWRRLEIAMLKAIGYQQGYLYLLFGAEALLLGFLGGVAGTILGALGSKLISDALARALALQVNFQFDLGTLVGGVVLGMGATLIFAVLPIVRAASFRPLELLREGAGVSTLRGIPSTIGLLAVILLLFGALAAGIMGDVVLAAEFIGGAFAVCLLLTGLFALLVTGIARLAHPRSTMLGAGVLVLLVLAMVLCIAREPALAPLLALAALIWSATVLLPAQARLPLLMATRSLARRRARTSVTLVAFLAGVLAMSVTLTVALSLQKQIDDALAGVGSVNLVTIANTSSEAQVLRAAHQLPGIRQHTTVVIDTTTAVAVNRQPLATRLGPAATPHGADPENEVGRSFSGFTGYDLAHGAQPTGIRVVAGRPLNSSDGGTHHVLLYSRVQDSPWYIQLGDLVTLRDTGSGVRHTVRVVGFYRHTQRRGFGSFFTPPVLGDRSVGIALGGGDAQSIISFNIDPNLLTQDASTLQRHLSGVLVLDVGDLFRVVETILNELLNLLAVITALALGAGLAVVANGVALAMLERRREIALLKAIGFGPGSVLRFVLVENALAGSLAGAVSVIAVVAALGLLSRLALQRAIGFDPLVAILVLLIATGLAVGTAYLTARGPVGVRPLEALRNE